MKQFDKILNEELEAMPVGSDVKGRLDDVLRIQQSIDETKTALSELEIEMQHALEEYNFALGVALRKKLPKVSIDFTNGRCSTKYKSANLSCRPDVGAQSWIFEPNQHGRRFSKKNGHLLKLDNQIEPLVNAMVGYFTNRYRSL